MSGSALAVALVEERVERGVVHAPPVGALGRYERAPEEETQDVRLAHLRELQDREVEVAAVQARDHRPELEGHDVRLDAHVRQLLRHEARDVAPQPLGRCQDREARDGTAAAREQRARGGRVEGQGRGIGVRPVGRSDEARRGPCATVEERRAEGSAVDGERDGLPHASVVERRMLLLQRRRT